jgi:hypothetical protein
VIVLTGDIEGECKIVSLAPDFTDYQELGQGSEDWRGVSPCFTSEAIYFGTDAQFMQNHLYKYNRETQSLASLCEVNGPIFYSCPTKNGFLFASTAEMCPSQTSPDAILYYLDPLTDVVEEITRFSKDSFPTRYFQFGIINFPILKWSVQAIPISGVALRGLDGRFVAF